MVDNRLEDTGCNVVLGSPLVNQGLDVRLGKNPTPGGDGVEPGVVFGPLVEALGVSFQKRCHLVDKGPSSPSANTVHPLLNTALEIGDLGVLASQFNGHIRLGNQGVNSHLSSHDLLDKVRPQILVDRQTPATRYSQAKGLVLDPVLAVLKNFPNGLVDIRIVPLVALINPLIFFVENDNLHRC